MWTGVVTLAQLRSRACWKVEFFCEEAPSSSRSAFEWVKIGTLVAERKEAIDPFSRPTESFHYIGLENVESVTGNLEATEPKRGSEIRSRSKIFHSGDILYGRLRPTLNKVCLVEPPMEDGICSSEFYVLIPRSDRVSPHLLRALLSSEYVRQYVSQWQTGSALPRLQLHDLLGIEVPLPLLSEQVALEEFLIVQSHRYRKLRAETAVLPQNTQAALMRALETGEMSGLSASEDISERSGLRQRP
jgi:hypothetical protein